MIDVSHLSKSFGTVKAVNDLTFSVKTGEIVGFLGPNGAGKTTTMRILTGFLLPDSGTVRIANKDITEHLTEAQQHIGYMPENNPLYKDMLVTELLSFVADVHGIPDENRKKAFDRVVEAAGIADVYNTPIGELSKGYKQRVGLAAALLHDPDVLVLDEPTEGLDPNQRHEIRKLIKELSQYCTVLMSTHVMQEVEAVCNRVLIISKGSFIADSTPEQLAREAAGVQTLIVDLEGKDIEKALKSLKGLKELQVNTTGKRVRATITAEKDVQLQPELSKFISDHHWTAWNISEQTHDLESVFARLTADNTPSSPS